jgi:hypothetical protein
MEKVDTEGVNTAACVLWLGEPLLRSTLGPRETVEALARPLLLDSCATRGPASARTKPEVREWRLGLAGSESDGLAVLTRHVNGEMAVLTPGGGVASLVPKGECLGDLGVEEVRFVGRRGVGEA